MRGSQKHWRKQACVRPRATACPEYPRRPASTVLYPHRRAHCAACSRRAPLSEIEVLKRDLQTHNAEQLAERRVVAEHRSESLRSSTRLFCVTDKLGSHWQYLPVPQGGRFTKASSSNWQYRQSIMGNLYPGLCNYASIVPPGLKTGGNFGCTSFVTTLYHLSKSKKLRPTVDSVSTQSDGGSDNVAWVTHIVNWFIIHVGVFNFLWWLRLRAGHSHNEADGWFSLIQTEVLAVGCNSPLELEARLVDSMKNVAGGCEALWQLSNYNFEAFFRGCVSKEFGHYKDERFWHYEYDETLPEHGCVKVTFKTQLTDGATSERDEMKPFVQASSTSLHAGSRRYQTDPKGLLFVQKFPSLDRDPGEP